MSKISGLDTLQKKICGKHVKHSLLQMENYGPSNSNQIILPALTLLYKSVELMIDERLGFVVDFSGELEAIHGSGGANAIREELRLRSSSRAR